jgi:outer membrane protein
MVKQISCVVGLLMVSLAPQLHAESIDFDRWYVKAGAGYIDPKSGNGDLTPGPIDVGSRSGPTVNIGYFFQPNWAVDVLLGLPFKHDLDINNARIGSTKHLPPTVSVQYHFNPTGAVRPYVGLGVNYTMIFDEKLNGGGRLQLGNSWGLAAQVGVDVPIYDKWTVGADLRYIDIDSKATVNGAHIGTVNIDPLVFGVNLGYRF